jgi:protein tyrosine phosphatase
VTLLKENAEVKSFLNATLSEKFSQKQFRRLAKRQDEREFDPESDKYTMEIARQNRSLNRYTDVSPYDSSRVTISSDDDDYVNASYIRTPHRTYIATQAPLPNTVSAFWKMMWENIQGTKEDTVSTIIMLTQCVEGAVEKCTRYWPRAVQHLEIPYNSSTLKVYLLEQENIESADCTINTIALCLDSGPKFTVKHMLYNGWRDMSIPLSTKTFLDYFTLYREFHTSEAAPVIHCSAGIGRTGVFIALDYLFEKVPTMTVEEVLKDPVFEIVDEMRKGRMSMVYKAAQLDYIYMLFREMILGEQRKG